jgi:hypothetical protein
VRYIRTLCRIAFSTHKEYTDLTLTLYSKPFMKLDYQIKRQRSIYDNVRKHENSFFLVPQLATVWSHWSGLILSATKGAMRCDNLIGGQGF